MFTRIIFILTAAILVTVMCSISCNTQPEPNEIPKLDSASKLKLTALESNIGKKFELEHCIDTTGELEFINFKKSKITIVDIWMNECPPCNKEMSQFEQLLKGKDNEIRVYSISVSSFATWKELFLQSSQKYSFLKNKIPNWVHLNLKSEDDPRLKNTISFDRLNELQTKLSVSFVPAYFVLDSSGKIIATPVSAVEYIKELNL